MAPDCGKPSQYDDSMACIVCVAGTYLEQVDASVWVLNSWDTAVGVQFFKGLLLHVWKFHVLRLIWQVQLLKYDGDFPWVWTLCLCQSRSLDSKEVVQ